jgi:integrase
MYSSNVSLHNLNGQRKYLNQVELRQFFECTKNQPSHKKLFCQLLLYTGARIAEIHNLTTAHIDFLNQTVILETLKKRKRGFFREILLPEFLLKDLRNYINGLELKDDETKTLWSFSLRTASRYVKTVMSEAGIQDIRRSAKSLRHGYAVRSVQKVPLTLVSKWLGHYELETTRIYLNILGADERKYARMTWVL